MKLGSSASFRSAGAYGDSDPEPFDDAPSEIAVACGQTSPNLSRRVIAHLPCDRELDHDGFCTFESVKGGTR